MDMTRNTTSPSSGKSGFARASDLLSAAAGIVLTFVLAPQLYQSSIDWAQDYAANNYGSGLEALTAFFWAVGCGLVTFGGCQLTISASLRLGLAKLAQILFPSNPY
jgi:hypothetical protein